MSPSAVAALDVFALYPIPSGPTVAALRGLTLTVPAGERLVVQGPNGSGKTTLLRMLAGELAPSSGALSVAGRDLVGGDRRAGTRLRRHELGLIAQNSGRALRPELDVLDNVALHLRIAGAGRQQARSTAATTLGALGLGALRDRRPATLSGGEAQRVAVCAAIAHRPPVVLADEPTGELDADSADDVYDLIDSCVALAGATLVLVTHDARAARIADRVVRIRDGRLSEQWHPDRPGDEALVLDPAGWLRLPDPVRERAGASQTVRVTERAGVVELTGDGAPGAGAPAAATVPGPLPPATEPPARLSGVAVSFGGRRVLAALDLVVDPGSLTVLRGRSGSGKSTVLNVLLGLIDPDDGRAELGGYDLQGLDRGRRADLRRRVAAVALQSGGLVETADARENLVLARRARGLVGADGVEELLAELDLLGVLRRPARLLSGGERQRVAIARSLAARRPLVVLDEPTSQQDERHAAMTTRVLAAAAAAGTAVVCATHDDVVAAAAASVVDLSRPT